MSINPIGSRLRPRTQRTLQRRGETLQARKYTDIETLASEIYNSVCNPRFTSNKFHDLVKVNSENVEEALDFGLKNSECTYLIFEKIASDNDADKLEALFNYAPKTTASIAENGIKGDTDNSFKLLPLMNYSTDRNGEYVEGDYADVIKHYAPDAYLNYFTDNPKQAKNLGYNFLKAVSIQIPASLIGTHIELWPVMDRLERVNSGIERLNSKLDSFEQRLDKLA